MSDCVVCAGAPVVAGHPCPECQPVDCLRSLSAESVRLRGELNRYVRLFNRLEAAISHHKAGERFPDDHDERLWAARDRILASAASSEEG